MKYLLITGGSRGIGASAAYGLFNPIQKVAEEQFGGLFNVVRLQDLAAGP